MNLLKWWRRWIFLLWERQWDLHKSNFESGLFVKIQVELSILNLIPLVKFDYNDYSHIEEFGFKKKSQIKNELDILSQN